MKLESKWLTSPETKRLFATLPKNSARFVGGCVRNALLGAPVADYDIATTLEPRQVAKRLKSANIAVHETGIAHGTLTAVVDGTVFEITTLRRDVSTDGRRATVEFTEDWAEDARRRDFTMNALYAGLDGEVYDPTGQGLDDIKVRKIRFVGNGQTRIKEDYLRILRFFRFNAWYGQDKAMDADGLTACRELKAGLKTLSAERVWSEIKKLLSAPAPFRTVNVMSVNGILETLLPEASNAEGLQLICALEENKSLSPDPYLRLMAMSARDELTMARLCKRLKMSNKEKARLMYWAGDQTDLRPGLSDFGVSDSGMSGKDTQIAIYTAGKQVAMDRAVIRSAGASDPIEAAAWWALYMTARDWEWPEFPVTGKDLISLGIPHGEKLGKALTALKALWIRSGFTVQKPQLLTTAKMLFLSSK